MTVKERFDGFPGFSFGKIFARKSWVIFFALFPQHGLIIIRRPVPGTPGGIISTQESLTLQGGEDVNPFSSLPACHA